MLIGRTQELVVLRDLLAADARLVTVVGPGGIGKTAIARALVERCPDPAVWVDLSGRHDLGSARDAVAEALGATASSIAVAAERHRLIVLDSVDGLDLAPTDAWAFAGELAAWVRPSRPSRPSGSTPSCRAPTWLVTSRRALGLELETVVPLGPLAPEDAAHLFLTRARSRAPGFVLGPAEERLIARLHGMPLALGLAASRAATLGTARVVEDELAELAWPAPDLAPRHESLRATVAWSIARLALEDRALLAALAHFAEGFELDDAVALVGDRARRGLERLVSASLVGASDRFALHPVVAELARGGDTAPYIRRVADHAEAALSTLYDGDPALGMERLTRYAGDLHRCWRLADSQHQGVIGLALSAHLLGRSEDAGRVLDELLATQSGVMAHKARLARGRLRYLEGRLADAERDARECLDFQDDEGDEATLLMSCIDRELGRGVLAARRCEEVLQRSAHPARRVWARLHLGSALLMSGSVLPARATYLEALGAAREIGARRVEALTIANLGFVAVAQGDHASARVRFQQALECFERIGDPRLGAKVALALARTHRALGLDHTAELARAEEVAERLADRATGLELSVFRAELAREVGDHGRARAHLEEALAVALAAGRSAAAERVRAMLEGAPRLRFAEGAWWFEGERGRVELRTRVALRRVLASLVERRVRAPGVALTTHALVEAGWPGERIAHEAAADRVYAAVGALRKLGLDGVLVRLDGGYALSPEVPIAVSPTP